MLIDSSVKPLYSRISSGKASFTSAETVSAMRAVARKLSHPGSDTASGNHSSAIASARSASSVASKGAVAEARRALRHSRPCCADWARQAASRARDSGPTSNAAADSSAQSPSKVSTSVRLSKLPRQDTESSASPPSPDKARRPCEVSASSASRCACRLPVA